MSVVQRIVITPRVVIARAGNALRAIAGARASSRADADVRAEFEAHLAMHIEENIRRGMTPDEARRDALLASGGLASAADHVRDQRGLPGLEAFASDLRHALRALASHPALSIAVIVTLALGIGANAAIYSVARHLLAAPLPYRDVEHVVLVMPPGLSGTGTDATGELADAWAARAHTLSELHAYARASYILQLQDGDDGAVTLRGARLSAGLLEMLGMQPILGRGIIASDTLPGAPAVVLLGEGVWRARFGARRDLLGQTIRLDDDRYTVVGIMPAALTLPWINGDDVWTPLAGLQPHALADVMAKLRPNVTAAAASREVRQIALATDAKRYASGAFVQPAAEFIAQNFGQHYRTQLLMLAAAVGLMLLIACANVANLLLARARARRREFAIRRALGAGSGRLVRLVLTESVVLALAGGALGIVFASRGLRLIIALRAPGLEELDGARIDPVILGLSLGLALVTGLLFGAAPALFAAGDRLDDLLKSDARTSTSGAASRRFRAGLVVAEVALSALLLIGAGLLARSLIAMTKTDVGFDPRGVVTFGLSPRVAGKPAPNVAGESMAAVAAVRGIPGVASAALSSVSPPGAMAFIAPDVQIDGHSVPLDLQPHVLATNRVQPEFFQALGLMPIRGRVFFAEPSDTSAAPSEVVVSESMAKRFWPTGGAIGGRFRPSDKAPWSTVVGVVHDSWVPVNQSSGRFDFQVYAPLRLPSFVESIVVRTTASDAVVVPRIIEAIRRTAPSLKVGRIETAESVIDRGLASPRFMATLLGAFAAVAFALTIVGLYGVIAYTVSQRTREIGLRMALGARARDVSWMVVFDGAFLATLGMLLGLVAAAGATRWMRSLLYGVQPGDPATYLSVGAGLVVTAVLASYVPARRAARVDPVAALRDE